MLQRVMSPFSVEIFCLTVPKNFVGEPFCAVFQKISGSQKFMDKRGGGGGSIKIFRRKIVVSQCRKMSWTSLQCFRKFGVSKNFMHNRGYHKFPSKLFLFHSAEKCRRGTLSLISGIEEVWMRGCGGGGGVSRFSVENFSHSAEKFRSATLEGVTNFGYRKNLCFRGLCHKFLSKFLVSQCRKIS